MNRKKTDKEVSGKHASDWICPGTYKLGKISENFPKNKELKKNERIETFQDLKQAPRGTSGLAFCSLKR
jgi:hypothetical protein